MAAVAADIGEPVIAAWAPITDIESGRSGRTRAAAATSAMTGYTANATYPVQHNKVKKKQTNGPIKVICWGFRRKMRSAIPTR